MFSNTKIKTIHAREVLDSRGNPTVACRVVLASGATAEVKVPSGASTGSHEARELRDGGKRYRGQGVLKAVENVNKKIAKVLNGLDASKQTEIDRIMCELDGTANKSRLGANAILSVSLACAQATALHRRMPLWKSLRQTFGFSRPPRMPYATMNLLNGGAHAGWVADVQEMMVVPKARRMADRVRIGSEIFHVLGSMLKEAGMATTVGDEGGYAPKLDRAETSLELLVRAIKKAGYKPGRDVTLAVDVASSEFYDKKSREYVWRAEGKEYTSEKMMERYQAWQDAFPLESIEDPFAEDDWASWSHALPILKKKSVVVGDDFFVTNVTRLERGIREKAANAILIKPNQIGTLSETVKAITLAQEAGWKTSISHRSGETADTTIADLAVACGSDYIKTGSLSRSERVEKYNRLMAIETEIGK